MKGPVPRDVTHGERFLQFSLPARFISMLLYWNFYIFDLD
jgi:hypothetical protein